MRDRVIFYLNGQRTEAAGDDVFLTLVEFLRRRRGLTGTKIVCAEGDCGSCAVIVGRPNGDKICYAAVTSCIQILFQLDAAHVITVEGLRDGESLNPIQQAMVSCQGTQCGFCTPGFVVALHDLMDDGQPIDAAKVRRGLTGNLCRCTGYDSIIGAALTTNRTSLKRIDEIFPPLKILNELEMLAAEEVSIETPSRRFYKPVDVQGATRFRQLHPGCSVTAGATDLGVIYNKKLLKMNEAMSLSGIQSLRAVRVEHDAMHLGAGVSLTRFQSVAQEHLPELGRFMEWFGSRLIRNAGTIGGNLVTGSPIGDTLPAMIALGAEVEIAGVAGNRRVCIEQFYAGYRKTVLANDELVIEVRIPLLREAQTLKLYKVSRRKDLDISSFGAAIWMKLASEIVEDIRIVFGGVGPMVMRSPAAEAMLRGELATLERFEQAGRIAREEITPISDVRGSADYRRTLAANILLKFWHEAIG